MTMVIRLFKLKKNLMPLGKAIGSGKFRNG